MAWIMRFTSKCKKGNDSTPYLSVPELRATESKVIVLVQQEAYPPENKDDASKSTSLMYRFSLNKEGDIMKCKGRLQEALGSEQVRNPILLSN